MHLPRQSPQKAVVHTIGSAAQSASLGHTRTSPAVHAQLLPLRRRAEASALADEERVAYSRASQRSPRLAHASAHEDPS